LRNGTENLDSPKKDFAIIGSEITVNIWNHNKEISFTDWLRKLNLVTGEMGGVLSGIPGVCTVRENGDALSHVFCLHLTFLVLNFLNRLG
jgi:hypothetical protein